MRRTSGFRRSSKRGSRPVRAREWNGFTTSPSGVPGEPGRIILEPGDIFMDWCFDPNDVIEFYDEPTLVRTIISDQCHPAVPGGQAASISCSLYVGLIVMKADELPVPLLFPDDSTKDWVYWSQWMMFNGGVNDGFVNAGPTRNPGDTIDIRSKRKLQSGMGLAIAALAALNNSHDVIWAFNARTLFLNG